MAFHVEKDALGEKKVPNKVLYGIHTLRAKENFQISGKTLPLEIFYAIAELKIACAFANKDLKLLGSRKTIAIVRAAKEILQGKQDKEFVIDAYQAGAGTPTHMNVNEVIANRANKLLKKKEVHANDDVNMGQSTNNIFPSAMKIVALRKLERLIIVLEDLKKALFKLGNNFKSIKKSGRTHLQDAVPITLGQEFHAYGSSIEKNIEWIKRALPDLKYLNIGKNAIGTGINTKKNFTRAILKHLKKINKVDWKVCKDPIYSTQNVTVFLEISDVLKLVAIDLDKIGNDLRLLTSGPNTGLKEINLPEVEAGSSIMPGKVNPSIIEMLHMVCYEVMGNDESISQGSRSGQLELNVMTPLIAKNLIESIDLLINGVDTFTKKCVNGITANKKICQRYYEHSAGLAALLNPYIGYDKAAEIMKESLRTRKSVRRIVFDRKLMSKKEVDKIFS
jgi:aspartate ammonia-lyase